MLFLAHNSRRELLDRKMSDRDCTTLGLISAIAISSCTSSSAKLLTPEESREAHFPFAKLCYVTVLLMNAASLHHCIAGYIKAHGAVACLQPWERCLSTNSA